jgi:hypothetical protein
MCSYDDEFDGDQRHEKKAALSCGLLVIFNDAVNS